MFYVFNYSFFYLYPGLIFLNKLSQNEERCEKIGNHETKANNESYQGSHIHVVKVWKVKHVQFHDRSIINS